MNYNLNYNKKEARKNHLFLGRESSLKWPKHQKQTPLSAARLVRRYLHEYEHARLLQLLYSVIKTFLTLIMAPTP